eukprot:4323993-Prymnesium_polylepis.1
MDKLGCVHTTRSITRGTDKKPAHAQSPVSPTPPLRQCELEAASAVMDHTHAQTPHTRAHTGRVARANPPDAGARRKAVTRTQVLRDGLSRVVCVAGAQIWQAARRHRLARRGGRRLRRRLARGSRERCWLEGRVSARLERASCHSEDARRARRAAL